MTKEPNETTIAALEEAHSMIELRNAMMPQRTRLDAKLDAARAELRYWHNIAEEAQRNARACLREIMELRKDEK